jgi:hypothetical protein|uniref:PH domain-containing protein n=1 Tax=Haptolina ericina TaxID=156174 RepID=A0A7S3BK62_9EUKA|mmetsp:Transcript_62197/g.138541  ORF Transcript_62197/g.138541 Transcript_62197/m.138541 type:complete len:190 (+) Transcript_62197:26-595(+)
MFAQAFTHWAMPVPLAERQMQALWKEKKSRTAPHADDFSWMHPPSPLVPENSSPKLSGWLGKQHSSRRWGKRFVDVDDYRGRLILTSKSRRPRDVCALQDIAICEALGDDANDVARHAFEIKCGGLHLTLDAHTGEDLRFWLVNLRARIAAWQDRAKSEGLAVAKPAFGAAGEQEWLRPAADGTWRADW